MAIATFEPSAACVCAYCKERIGMNDHDTITMILSRFVGIEQDPFDTLAMDCEQKIVTQGHFVNVIFHRKCLIEFFKNSTINITESIINGIGEQYPIPTDQSDQIKMLIKRGKLK